MIIIIILLAVWILWTEIRIQKLEIAIDRVLFISPQMGNLSRKWKGYWKVKPEDHDKIFRDPRTCAEIAKDYNVSLSHISQIKRNYKTKTNLC